MKGKGKLVCLSLLTLLASCSGAEAEEIQGNLKKNAADPNSLSVWTASSNEKILSDKEYSSEENTLSLSMAKNEYEGGQIVLSAKKNINSFTVEVSDLVDGKNKIQKKYIDVFFEKYLTTKISSNRVYPLGSYPDPIVPFDAIVAAKENKIAQGSNQSLYIRVHTLSRTHAGNYSGTIKITLDGEVKEVPINVKVFDFEVPETVHTKSSFLIYPTDLVAGEGDSSLSMQKKYYDFLLDYRISGMNLPSSMDVTSFSEALKEYGKNPKVSAFNIPAIGGYGDSGGYNTKDFQEMVKRIVGLSVEDHYNYLAKAYTYNLYSDEYTLDGSGNKQKRAIAWEKIVKDVRETLPTYYDSHFGKNYLDQVRGLRESLKNLLNMAIPYNYNPSFSYPSNGNCFILSSFQDDAMRKEIQEKFTGDGKEVWWYGCNNPVYPYPSYHIDDNPLSPRIMSWEQYDYGIQGNLYYKVNSAMSSSSSTSPVGNPIDVWDHSSHVTSGSARINGDGWLVYPGKRYKIDGPIPSLRLEEIRDGLEEYEYLYYLDSLFKNLSSKYNRDLSVQQALRSTFDSLYRGTYPTTDPKVFEEAKANAVEAITLAKQGIVFESKEKTENKYIAKMLFPSSVSISNLGHNVTKAKEETITSECKEVTFEVAVKEGEDSLLSFDYTLNGTTSSYENLLAKASYVLVSASHQGSALLSEMRAAGEGSTLTLGSVDSLAAYHYQWTAKDSYFTLLPAFMKRLSRDMTTITFRLYNDSDEDVALRLSHVLDGKNVKEVQDTNLTLKSKAWTEVSIALNDVSSYLNFQFSFPEAESGSVYLEEVRYTK